MKTKMQQYLSRNENNPILEVFAQNKKGDEFTWKTNVLPSILKTDRKKVEELLIDKISITLGDINILTWNITNK